MKASMALEEDQVLRVLKQVYTIVPDSMTKLVGASPSQSWMISYKKHYYLIRKCIRSGDASWIENQLQVIEKLLERQFPVQPVLISRYGEKNSLFEESLWQMRPYILGKCLEKNNKLQEKETIFYLAQLHSYSDITLRPNQWSNGITNWLEKTEECLKKLKYQLTPFYSDQKLNNLLIFYHNVIDKILTSINMDKYLELPQTLTHGDYHGNNLIFQNQKLVCVIDLDTIGTRARVLDLAISAYLIKKKKSGSFEHDTEETVNYFKNYEQYSNLKENEINSIVPLLLTHFLPNPSYIDLVIEHSPHLLDWYITWSYKAVESVESQFSPIIHKLQMY